MRASPKREQGHAQRLKLIDRLKDEHAEDLAVKLESCGKPVGLTCTNCGGHHTVETHCRARWCPACAPIVSAERHSRWRSAIRSIKWPLFVTLTLPNSEDPEQLRVLRQAWSAFRRRKLIVEKVRGGVATFEVTNKGRGWHPHLHAVCDCRWLSLDTREPTRRDTPEVVAELCRRAQEELSALWAHQIRQPLGIVYVRRVYGDDVASEILKYAVKGSDLLESPTPIAPMLRVLRKTRTLSGWGSLHPLPSPDDELNSVCQCTVCGAEKSFVPDELIEKMLAHKREEPLPRLVHFPHQ